MGGSGELYRLGVCCSVLYVLCCRGSDKQKYEGRVKETGSVYVVVLGPGMQVGAADELVPSYGDVAQRPQIRTLARLGASLFVPDETCGAVPVSAPHDAAYLQMSGSEDSVTLRDKEVLDGKSVEAVEAVEAGVANFMRVISHTEKSTPTLPLSTSIKTLAVGLEIAPRHPTLIDDQTIQISEYALVTAAAAAYAKTDNHLVRHTRSSISNCNRLCSISELQYQMLLRLSQCMRNM